MTSRRLRAPSDDRGVLSVPSPDSVVGLIADNRASLGEWTHDFQGRPANRLRSSIRGELLGLARAHLQQFGHAPADEVVDGPLIVTGHQPELFHPGVWIKNFAIAGAARASGGTALNLIVDNDLPKASGIRVPRLLADRLATTWVDYDSWADEVPFEDGRIHDESLFDSFADRALETLGGAIANPLLRHDWTHAQAARAVTDRLGARLAAMRRHREADWGVRNLELPLGSLCESEGFLWFASHLLAHLPRFQTVHNDALSAYRALHKIRSKNHPVASLRTEGDWIEAPFWAWRAQRPRRKPLLARQVNAQTLQLRLAGEDEPLLELPLGPDREACCAVDRLRDLPALGVRLRTRALTTTMFARSLLGDLFLHGIGGAKYDELGDEVARRFFNAEPPPFWTLSLTLRLGLPEQPGSARDLQETEQLIRHLRFHPEQALTDAPPSLIEAKRDALAGPIATRRQRVERFAEIRRANQAFEPLVADQIAAAEAARTRLREVIRWNQSARSREFAAALHSTDRLKSALVPFSQADALRPPIP